MAAQWTAIEHTVLLVWLACMSVVSVWRWGKYRAFCNRSNESNDETQASRHSYIVGAVLSGIVWGSAAYLLIPADNAVHQTMVIAVLIGMSAGSVVTLSPVPSAAYSYLFLVLVPLIARLLTMGSTPNFALGVMTILFIYIMASAVRDWHRTLREALWVRHEEEQAKATIEHLAYHDDLTNLPNRRQLAGRLESAIESARQHKQTGAVLFLDLDRFKTINDSIGHQIGDELLMCVSQRLLSHLREPDVAGRLGGDEFIILLNNLGTSREHARATAEKIVARFLFTLSQPFHIGDHELQITSSAGVALFPHDGEDVDDLLKFADTAMYCAKAEGRNTTRFFIPEMQVAAHRKLLLEKNLRAAIENQELRVFYQPLLSLNDGVVTGVEALVRWQHPQLGLVAPAEFIPLAEESNLIVALGANVMQQACKDAERIRASLSNSDRFTLSINISPREFYHDNFVERTLACISESGLTPRYFQLELTEGVLLFDLDSALATMARLKMSGLQLAIDDFGTGHSSLAYLKDLPIDTLKIDQSFIRTIDSKPVDATIVENTINMARQLELKVVAEGIESQSAIDMLRTYNCDEGQGYCFCRPVPVDELCVWLSSRQDSNGNAQLTNAG